MIHVQNTQIVYTHQLEPKALCVPSLLQHLQGQGQCTDPTAVVLLGMILLEVAVFHVHFQYLLTEEYSTPHPTIGDQSQYSCADTVHLGYLINMNKAPLLN